MIVERLDAPILKLVDDAKCKSGFHLRVDGFKRFRPALKLVATTIDETLYDPSFCDVRRGRLW